jgi:hypothetical protein
MRNVLDENCRESTTRVLCSITSSRKSCRFWDNIEKYGGAVWGHKWRNNMAHTRCMLDKQGYTRARAHTHTHTHRYVILIAFPRQKWFANTPHCYIVHSLSVLFSYKIVRDVNLFSDHPHACVSTVYYFCSNSECTCFVPVRSLSLLTNAFQ